MILSNWLCKSTHKNSNIYFLVFFSFFVSFIELEVCYKVVTTILFPTYIYIFFYHWEIEWGKYILKHYVVFKYILFVLIKAMLYFINKNKEK